MILNFFVRLLLWLLAQAVIFARPGWSVKAVKFLIRHKTGKEEFFNLYAG